MPPSAAAPVVAVPVALTPPHTRSLPRQSHRTWTLLLAVAVTVDRTSYRGAPAAEKQAAMSAITAAVATEASAAPAATGRPARVTAKAEAAGTSAEVLLRPATCLLRRRHRRARVVAAVAAGTMSVRAAVTAKGVVAHVRAGAMMAVVSRRAHTVVGRRMVKEVVVGGVCGMDRMAGVAGLLVGR